jgi:hypothetical protein
MLIPLAILCAVSVIAGLVAAIVYRRTRRFLATAVRCEGRPVGWKKSLRQNGQHAYYERVAYTAADGTTHEILGASYAKPWNESLEDAAAGAVRDALSSTANAPAQKTYVVYYDPARPDRARFGTFSGLWGSVIVLAILAVVPAVFAVLVATQGATSTQAPPAQSTGAGAAH